MNSSNGTTENVVILGSGPAGLTAAIYAARARLNPLVVSGTSAGGQLMITTDVENYPGFPEGIMGPQLIENFRQQAERFGTRFMTGDIEKVDFSGQIHRLFYEDKYIDTKSVILATGASAKLLGLKSEIELMGHGVSACATCDGFFFRDKKVFVVGGGDTAMEEANFLTRFASSVTILHRRDSFRASKIMQERVLKNPKIDVVWNTVVDDVLGLDEKKFRGVKVRDMKENTASELSGDGLFIAIGHEPNTKFLKGHVDLDETGYIKIKQNTETNVAGVFAAGDVHDLRYRQAITAAGKGAAAAIDAERYLETLEP